MKTTLKWTRNPVIRDKARATKLHFNSLNKAYALVHKDVSHTNPIPPGSLAEMKTNIDAYMAVYRQHFKNKIIPKQHILESHCLPFIQKHKMGLGLLGEQDGELIHCTIATLEKKDGMYMEGGEKDENFDGVSSSSSCSLPTPLRSKNKEKKDSAAVKLSLYFLFIVCTNTVLCIYIVCTKTVYIVF